jgi:phage shock protein E
MVRKAMHMRVIPAAAFALLLASCGAAPPDAPAPPAAAPEQPAVPVAPDAEAAVPAAPTPVEPPGAEAPAAPAAPVRPSSGRAQLAAEAAAQQPIYLDVRTPEEFAAGHVAGTLHIPLDQLERRWAELAEYRDRPVVVYCRTGRRSGLAIDMLATKGFTRLENGGGVTQMARRGLRMEPENCC